jgi:hypothetical protein
VVLGQVLFQELQLLPDSHHSTNVSFSSVTTPEMYNRSDQPAHHCNLSLQRKEDNYNVINVVGQVGAGFISRISRGHQKPCAHGGLPHNVWVQTVEAQPSQHGLIVPDAWFCIASAIRTRWVVPFHTKLRTPHRNVRTNGEIRVEVLFNWTCTLLPVSLTSQYAQQLWPLIEGQWSAWCIMNRPVSIFHIFIINDADLVFSICF